MTERKPSGRGFGFGSRLSSSPQSLVAAETLCTGAIVTYDLMGTADKKLPRPGPIVASVGFYALLGLAAAASETFAPVVVVSGWVLALSVLVTGKRGQGIVGLLGALAGYVGKLGGGGAAAASSAPPVPATSVQTAPNRHVARIRRGGMTTVETITGP